MSTSSRSISYSFLKIVIHSGCRASNKLEWINEWKTDGSPRTAHSYGASAAANGDMDFSSGELTKKSRENWARMMFLLAFADGKDVVHLYSCQRATVILEAALAAGAEVGNVTFREHGRDPVATIGTQVGDAADAVYDAPAEVIMLTGPITLTGLDTFLTDTVLGSTVNASTYRIGTPPEGTEMVFSHGSTASPTRGAASCELLVPVQVGSTLHVKNVRYAIDRSHVYRHVGFFEKGTHRVRHVHLSFGDTYATAGTANELAALALGALRNGQESVFLADTVNSGRGRNREIAARFGEIEI